MCSSLAHFALKIGALRLNLETIRTDAILNFSLNRWLVFGGSLHVIALWLWVVGLRHVELSVAYPFVALGLVLVTVLSWLFLKEMVNPIRLTGMLLISSGVLLIARG